MLKLVSLMLNFDLININAFVREKEKDIYCEWLEGVFRACKASKEGYSQCLKPGGSLQSPIPRISKKENKYMQLCLVVYVDLQQQTPAVKFFL
jgi:hypothetical protein